jgi:hypothetical protein
MSSSNKRLNDSDEPPAKKKATLSQWLNVPPPPPYTPGLVVSSFPITDSQSTFIAFATSANTAADAISTYHYTIVDTARSVTSSLSFRLSETYPSVNRF